MAEPYVGNGGLAAPTAAGPASDNARSETAAAHPSGRIQRPRGPWTNR